MGMLGLGTQFHRDEIFGPRAQATADIVAGDDEVGAGIIDTADQQMNVGIVGVPMVDSDPVELRTEIGLHLPGEIEGKRLEIGHLAGILWRDDEPEMMPVTLAAVGKGSIIGAV